MRQVVSMSVLVLGGFLSSTGLAQDIIFSKNCLDAAAVELTQSPTLSSDELMDLRSFYIRSKNEKEAYEDLLNQTKVTFPSGQMVDMRSSTTVSSRGAILKEADLIAATDAEDNLSYQSYFKQFEQTKRNGAFGEGSFDEFLVLKGYKGSGYRNINAGLRYHKFGSPEYEASFIRTIQYLNSALNRIKPFEGMVKRGATLRSEVINQFEKGKLFSFKTYVSTSLNKIPFFITSREDNKVVFILKSRTGRAIENVIYGRNSHSDLSMGEGEVLFKPQTIFKILDVKKDDGVTKIYADEMP